MATTDRCPTCDKPRAGDVAMSHADGCTCTDCLSVCWLAWGVLCEPADWRARALAAEADKSCRVCDRVDAMTYACEPSWEKTRADATRWRKVAPLIERLADDVRRRELIARAEFDRRVSDTVTALLAATQEPTL